MKPAIRLEISKKDEKHLLDKVRDIVAVPEMVETSPYVQELVTFYRTQLHAAFKMGLKYNPIQQDNE